MPPTSQLHDCRTFAQSVTGAGGELPAPLQRLLDAHALLTSPRAAEDSANAILDAAADGTLDQKLLDKLLPAAAAAATANTYRQELASRAERMLVQRWYRLLRGGMADSFWIPSGRNSTGAPRRSRRRRLWGSTPSPPWSISSQPVNPASSRPGTNSTGTSGPSPRSRLWRAQFGSRPTATFPQVKEFTPGHVHLLDDRALSAATVGCSATVRCSVAPTPVTEPARSSGPLSSCTRSPQLRIAIIRGRLMSMIVCTVTVPAAGASTKTASCSSTRFRPIRSGTSRRSTHDRPANIATVEQEAKSAQRGLWERPATATRPLFRTESPGP